MSKWMSLNQRNVVDDGDDEEEEGAPSSPTSCAAAMVVWCDDYDRRDDCLAAGFRLSVVVCPWSQFCFLVRSYKIKMSRQPDLNVLRIQQPRSK